MMFKFFKILSFLFFLVILSPLSSCGVFAASQFNDNFSNLDNWEIVSNGFTGSWVVNNNELLGSVEKQGNSFVLFKNLSFGKNFELTYEAKNNFGIDQELLFHVDKESPEFYVINTRFYEPNWTEDNANEVVIWKCFSFEENNCSEVFRENDLGFTLNKNQFYRFKLSIDNKNISFYIDDRKIIDHVLLNDYVGGVGFWNWGGDYDGGVSNVYKNFSIISYDYDFPTPTPVQGKKKIFILPGLGASWNSKAIVYGQSVNNSDWEMTPFVNNYDGLVELLNKNGLEKDKDYFVWNYDWRKSVGDIKNDFNVYFNSKNLSNGDDVYLIGHSLGGVVARLWAQDNNNENIKKVITLGSPNLGSVDSYSVWNGGKVLKNNGLSSVIFNIILGLQNKGFVLTDLNKIRSYVPVVKDLLPVFDYVTKNKKMTNWRELESHNDFLKNQNDNLSSVVGKFKPFVGVGFSTPNVINLTSRSFVSKSLGLWPDGEIKNYSTLVGDGTVLKNSSGMGLDDMVEINSKHGDIPSNSISQIALNVGLSNVSTSSDYTDNFSDGLVVFVGSPVTSFLKCGNDTYQENEGFILVKNKNYSDCDLNLSPTDNGTVHIVLGNLNNNQWNYFEDEVTLGNLEKIKIDYKKAEIKVDVSNKQIIKDQIKNDLEKLGLSKAIKFLDKNDFGKVAWYVFEYRKNNSERVVSQRILDNLFILGAIVSPDKVRGNYKWLDVYIDLMERTLDIKSKKKNISQKSVESLVQLQNLKNKIDKMIKDKKYPDYSVVAILSLGYGDEAMRN